jgi:hypothetical protein
MKELVKDSTPFDSLAPLQKLALVTSPALPDGVGGFYLDIYEEDQIEVNAEVTDHYTEKNAAIHDHMALRPETVTVHGIVGEIALLKQKPKDAAAAQRDTLPTVEDYLPELTIGALQGASEAATDAFAVLDPVAGLSAAAASNVTTAVSAFAASAIPAPSPYDVYRRSAGISASDLQGQSGYLKAEPTKRRQKDAFAYLYALWKGRQFVTVETPWGVFETMVITNLRVEQGKDTKSQSDFYVTFKAIRFAEEIVVQPIADSRAQEQNAPVAPVGTAGQVPTSLLLFTGETISYYGNSSQTKSTTDLRSP